MDNYLILDLFVCLMNKYLIALIVLGAIVLLYVFFPKPIGSTCGFCAGPPSIILTQRSCLGWQGTWSDCPGCMDAGSVVHCIGIPYGKEECYTQIGRTWLKYTDCALPPGPDEILGACTQGFEQCNLLAAWAAFKRNDTARVADLCARAQNESACRARLR